MNMEEYAVMPVMDYEDICDATREMTGGTELLKSGEVAPAIRSIQSGGAELTITVTVDSGSMVTATKGETTISGTSVDGVCVLIVPEAGEWIVQATLNGENSHAATIEVVDNYEVYLNYTHIYGAEWNGKSATKWSRTDEAAGFTDPVPAVANGSGSSPFDNLMPWSGIHKVEDPIAGTLVSIPKFWYQWTRSGTIMRLQIATTAVEGFYVSPAHADRGDGAGERDVVYVGRYHCDSSYKSAAGSTPKSEITRATARTSIHELGANIWQYDFAMYWTICMLYLVEFADWNSQAVIGYGCSPSGSKFNNGATDAMGYHTGTSAANRTTYGSVQYRWIEGLWDNVFDWCDGIYFSGTTVYGIKNPADFSDTTGGTELSVRPDSTGYITTWRKLPPTGFEWAIYPTIVGGSDGTYVCDQCSYVSIGIAMCCGGNYTQAPNYGLFYLNGDSTASSAYGYVGCRLMKLP